MAIEYLERDDNRTNDNNNSSSNIEFLERDGFDPDMGGSVINKPRNKFDWFNGDDWSRAGEGLGIATGFTSDIPEGGSRAGEIGRNMAEGARNMATGAVSGGIELGADALDFAQEYNPFGRSEDNIGLVDAAAEGLHDLSANVIDDIPENTVGGALGEEIAQMYLGGKIGDAAIASGKAAYGAGKKMINDFDPRRIKPDTDAPLNGYQPTSTLEMDDLLLKKQTPKDIKNRIDESTKDVPIRDQTFLDDALKRLNNDIKNREQTIVGMDVVNNIKTINQPLDGKAIQLFDKARLRRDGKIADDAPYESPSKEAVSLENMVNSRNKEGTNVDPRWFDKDFDKTLVREDPYLDSYLFRRLVQSSPTKKQYSNKIADVESAQSTLGYAERRAQREINDATTASGAASARTHLNTAKNRSEQLGNERDTLIGLQKGAPESNQLFKQAITAGGVGAVVAPGIGAVTAAAPYLLRAIKNNANRIGRNNEIKRLANETGVPIARVKPYMEPSIVGSAFNKTRNAMNYNFADFNAGRFIPGNNSLLTAGILGNEGYDAYQQEPPKTKKERNVDKAYEKKVKNMDKSNPIEMSDEDFLNQYGGR